MSKAGSCTRLTFGNDSMTKIWISSAAIVVLSLSIKGCSACSANDADGSTCWYTLWYIWFVLGLFLIVTGVIIVLYIQHRSKERNRSRRRRRSTRTVPIHIVPTGPPGYAEPSHKPPSYEEAIRNPHAAPPQTQVPGGIVTFADEYGYRPPPTSLRMVPSSDQPQPPSYSVSVQGQGQGHPS